METTNTSTATPNEELQSTITTQEHEQVIAEKDRALELLQEQLNELTTADSLRVSDLAEAAKIIEGQKATIDQHEATIATLQGTKSEEPMVTVDGKVYRITAPAAQIKKGVTVTAAEIIKDKKLAAELVKLGVGFMELVTDKKSK